jgi:TPR repeat protein
MLLTNHLSRHIACLLGLLLVSCGTVNSQVDGSINESKLKEAIQFYNSGKWKDAHHKALPLAEQGDAEAQSLMGALYAQGRLGPIDFVSARQWWEQAAISGNTVAQYNYAMTYLQGDGTRVDRQLAREWLTEASYGGHKMAMNELGNMLLSENDKSGQTAAIGYMWLRIANIYKIDDAKYLLKSAMDASGITYSRSQSEQLQMNALRSTVPYANAKGSNLLSTVDRGEIMAYSITRGVFAIAGMQGMTSNAAELSLGLKSQETLRDIGLNASRRLNVNKNAPQDIMHWVFYRKGFKLNGPEVVSVSPTMFWDLARPGDLVEVADGINSHVTFVFAVDRTAGRIDFIDAWPRESMLLPGRNVRNVKAQLQPLGKSRLLLSISKDEFIAITQGILTESGPSFIDSVFERFPELRSDQRVNLGVGSILVHHKNATIACKGAEFLWSFLSSENEKTHTIDRDAASDRLAIGIDLCKEADILKLHYQNLDNKKTSEITVHELSDVVKKRLHPTLASLDPGTLTIFAHIKMQHGEITEAINMVNDGLSRFPDNENLLLARAFTYMYRKQYDYALTDLGKNIKNIETKLGNKNALIRDAGFNNLVGRNSGKQELLGILREAYLYRGAINMETKRPHEAIKDALSILQIDENDGNAMYLAIKAYEAIGDTKKAMEFREKIKDAETHHDL